MTRKQSRFIVLAVIIFVLWVIFTASTAHAQQVTGRTLAISPTAPTPPTGSSVNIKGLGTKAAGQELITTDTNGNWMKGLLVPGDIPSQFTRRDLNELIANLWTFGAGLTSSGNLTFTGAGRRIQGDFTSGTASDRTSFQTSTANSPTTIQTLPSGTGSQSGFFVFNNSDPTMGANGQFLVNSTEVRIRSAGVTPLPLMFMVGTTERLRFLTDGTTTHDGRWTHRRLDAPGTSLTTEMLANGDALLTLSTTGRSVVLQPNLMVNGGTIGSTASDLTVRPDVNLRLRPQGSLWVNPDSAFVVEKTQTMNPGAHIQTDNWASRLTGWRVGYLGDADFRTMFSNELKVTTFTNDVTQATNGDLMVTKSATTVADPFTCPALGSAGPLVVDDMPSMPGARVFSVGDYVAVQNFTRSDADADGASSLDLTFCVGSVTAYVDGPADTQTWTFTRATGLNGGGMTGGLTVAPDAPVLNYGVSTNGIIKLTANDGNEGIDAPYLSIATWATSPAVTNWSSRARLGNLRGMTSVTGEYGLLAGTYSTTNGKYFRASNQAFELHGIDLTMWDSANAVIKLTPDGNAAAGAQPSFAMGATLPAGFASGTGVWMGKDTDNAYKFRVGDPNNQYMSYDGTTLRVAGVINVTAPGGNVETVTGSQAKANTAEANATAVANTKETPAGAQSKATQAENNATAVANQKVAMNGGQMYTGVLGSTGTTVDQYGMYAGVSPSRIHLGSVSNVPSYSYPAGCQQPEGGLWAGVWDMQDGYGTRARFCVGNGTNNYLSFNGHQVTIRGSLNADDVVAGTLTGRTIRSHTGITGPTGAGFWLDYTGTVPRFFVGNTAARYISFDGSSLGINASSMSLSGALTLYGNIGVQVGNWEIVGSIPGGNIGLRTSGGSILMYSPLGNTTTRVPGIYATLPAVPGTYVAVVTDTTGALSYVPSTRAQKRDIEPMSLAYARLVVDKLSPVRYRGVTDVDRRQPLQAGLLVEDVQAAGINELLGYYHDKPAGVTYDRLAVYLMMLVKDHEARLKAMETR